MATAILIDAERREIGAVEVNPSAPTFEADLVCAIGGHSLGLGSRLPDGCRIYVDAMAIHTSDHFFRHCLLSTPLPGRGIIIGNRALSVDSSRAMIDFLDRDEVFSCSARPFALWSRRAALDLPGIAVTCGGQSWRC